MKKLCATLLIAGMGISVLPAQAQNTGKAFYKQPYQTRNSGSFSKDASILSIGYGFPNESGTGYSHWNNGNRMGFGPAYIKYEHGVIDELGIGGYAAFAASRYKYNNDDVDRTVAIGMGVLAYYHFNKLIPVKQLDVYAGAGIGFRNLTYTEDGRRGSDSDTDFEVLPIINVGARWYFTPRFAVYLEGGYDEMSEVNTGITFSF